MRWALAAFLLLASAGLPARADEVHDLAADIVARTGSTNNMVRVLQLTRQQIVAVLVAKSGKTDAEAGAIVDELIMPHMRAVIPRLQAAVVGIYAQDYGLADLRALDGFYRSTAGQHLLARQPQVAADTVRAMLAVMQEAVGQIERDNADKLRQRGVVL